MPNSELEAYDWVLQMHIRAMIDRLRKMDPAHWDWSPYPAAPTARTVAVHAWQWLMCDRQHILHGDMIEHVAEVPEDPLEFCKAFEQEAAEWHKLVLEMPPGQLDRPLRQFGFKDSEFNVRWFICHMIQNVIYKSGQLSWAYFALGYDGDAPYSAPFPNQVFDEIRSGAITA